MGVAAVALAGAGVMVFTVAYFVLVDLLFRRLQALRPQGCSIYDRAFWRHERFWKICPDTYLQPFNGTPFKTAIWRLLGVRIGRRVFDDGLSMTERTFATIGDGCTFNVGSVIQCHSQEDGGFKSDRTAIGAGCTLGVGAFVHYGVTMGDGAVLAADSFLMKGEEMPPLALWGGNPAKKTSTQPTHVQARPVGIGAGRVPVAAAPPPRPVRRGGVPGVADGIDSVTVRVPAAAGADGGDTVTVRVPAGAGTGDTTVTVRAPAGAGTGDTVTVRVPAAGTGDTVTVRAPAAGADGVDTATDRVTAGADGVDPATVRVASAPPRPMRRGRGGAPGGAGADTADTATVRVGDGPPRPIRRRRGRPRSGGADVCRACGKHRA
jgi:acetyltransferase-like isoleucine patch superfamily enzyme